MWSKRVVTHDGIYEYACETLILFLIWHTFHDAIKESDGSRALLLWKLLLLVYKSTNR